MLAPKRLLPSLSMLSIFEAAARRGSFSAAAEELCLSQSAVSRQIKCLESQLEHELFVRDRKTVRITDAGERYAKAIREALLLIANASINLRASPERNTLNLAILPSLGGSWLVPRLSGFLEENPDIKINLTTYTEPFDFHKENIDVAIHFGSDRWNNAETRFLMREKLIPVCSAEFLKKHPLGNPETVLDVPLIHLTIRPDAWERWLRSQDVEFDYLTGMMIDRFEIAIKAAQCGMGLALIPEILLSDYLANGTLACPFKTCVESEGAYYLVWSRDTGYLTALSRIYDWLEKEIKACDISPANTD
ncbi:LysR substrate-binding domain-containing protein [Microbulbifer rhizosphaerae]|uniref:LysR family glycine cleavage system transcriptional activator n=1 Tax=Microbulbifer rhizosphaerae TaxID=1562603 RepID=A0A7W4WEI3_9GAMM|nr:LysR substrate-binding domain-containing protein [Microbulbifer rhizosphaerae]MBB3062750.1 LysR family glycine cleavage system transcriptional activator [Microbulbifer rhizosphaerae]